VLPTLVEFGLSLRCQPARPFRVLEHQLSPRTESRSTLAVMNNTASQLRYIVASIGGLGRAQIEVVNHLLRRTPHLRDGKWLTPIDVVSAEVSWPRRFDPIP